MNVQHDVIMSVGMFQGHCFIAVNPACFAPDFDGRLSELVHQLKDLDKAIASSSFVNLSNHCISR